MDYFVAWPGTQTVPIDSDCSFFLRPYHRLTTPRDTKTAENIEVRIPRAWTMAKPRTAPEPNTSSASATIKVVTLESKMVAQARSKPAEMADCGDAPERNSSRMRSLISTLASNAMPSASAIAAMPGKVKVACMADRIATSSSTLTASASTLKKPNIM